MRDFSNWNSYLDELAEDIYPSPSDEQHTIQLKSYLRRWGHYFKDAKTVLDVGCGDDAVAEKLFDSLGLKYTGVSLGTPTEHAVQADFSFLSEYNSNSYGMIFSRHSLEHSPAPLLTLMEWHRVSSGLLGLVVPNPENVTYAGRNHYSVADKHQIVWWLRRAGWQIVVARFMKKEFQFVCKKKPRISYEGYVSAPLLHDVHAFERDALDITDEDILFGNMQ